MKDKDWHEWMEYHQGLFGWSSEKWFDVLLKWRPAFEAAGITVEEAAKASDEVVRDPQLVDGKRQYELLGPWVLQALIRRAQEIRGRAVREMIKRNQELHPEHTGERSACETCDGSGLVIVPHLCCVSNGEWVHPFATFAVACMCPLGGYKLSHTQEHTGKFRIMGLGDYQRKNDLWMQQMADRAKAQGALDRAINEAATLRPGDLEFLKAKIGSQVGSGRKSA